MSNIEKWEVREREKEREAERRRRYDDGSGDQVRQTDRSERG